MLDDKKKQRGRPTEIKGTVVKGISIPLLKEDIRFLNRIKKHTGMTERACVKHAIKFFAQNLNKDS